MHSNIGILFLVNFAMHNFSFLITDPNLDSTISMIII